MSEKLRPSPSEAQSLPDLVVDKGRIGGAHVFIFTPRATNSTENVKASVGFVRSFCQGGPRLKKLIVVQGEESGQDSSSLAEYDQIARGLGMGALIRLDLMDSIEESSRVKANALLVASVIGMKGYYAEIPLEEKQMKLFRDEVQEALDRELIVIIPQAELKQRGTKQGEDFWFVKSGNTQMIEIYPPPPLHNEDVA